MNNLTPNDLKLLQAAVEAIESFIDEEPEQAGRFIDTRCGHCTDGNTPARIHQLCWRHEAKLRLTEKPEKKYRIEKRNDKLPTEFWSAFVEVWVRDGSRATIYTEKERTEFLNKELRGEPNGFPSGGVWVVLNGEAK